MSGIQQGISIHDVIKPSDPIAGTIQSENESFSNGEGESSAIPVASMPAVRSRVVGVSGSNVTLVGSTKLSSLIFTFAGDMARGKRGASVTGLATSGVGARLKATGALRFISVISNQPVANEKFQGFVEPDMRDGQIEFRSGALKLGWPETDETQKRVSAGLSCFKQ